MRLSLGSEVMTRCSAKVGRGEAQSPRVSSRRFPSFQGRGSRWETSRVCREGGACFFHHKGRARSASIVGPQVLPFSLQNFGDKKKKKKKRERFLNCSAVIMSGWWRGSGEPGYSPAPPCKISGTSRPWVSVT